MITQETTSTEATNKNNKATLSRHRREPLLTLEDDGYCGGVGLSVEPPDTTAVGTGVVDTHVRDGEDTPVIQQAGVVWKGHRPDNLVVCAQQYLVPGVLQGGRPEPKNNQQ